MIKFEKVSFEQFEKDMKKCTSLVTPDAIYDAYESIEIPTRGTEGSAGYDISIPYEFNIEPYSKSMMLPTGLRIILEDQLELNIHPRSSIGIKKDLLISNTIPVIDTDYHLADNEGHIMLVLRNMGPNQFINEQEGNKWKPIVQGVITKYYLVDNDVPRELKRVGGIGSTDTGRTGYMSVC